MWGGWQLPAMASEQRIGDKTVRQKLQHMCVLRFARESRAPATMVTEACWRLWCMRGCFQATPCMGVCSLVIEPLYMLHIKQSFSASSGCWRVAADWFGMSNPSFSLHMTLWC